MGNTISKNLILKNTTQKWKNRFTNSCLHFGTNYGILHLLSDVASIIEKNPTPLYGRPRLVDSLCALLTGHSKRQLHLYRLKLTFSATCICLAEEKKFIHFLSECKLFSHIRNCIKPMREDWHSIMDFIKGTCQLPKKHIFHFVIWPRASRSSLYMFPINTVKLNRNIRTLHHNLNSITVLDIREQQSHLVTYTLIVQSRSLLTHLFNTNSFCYHYIKTIYLLLCYNAKNINNNCWRGLARWVASVCSRRCWGGFCWPAGKTEENIA